MSAGATISLDEEGRVFGKGSCNQYSGAYALTAEGFKADKFVTTQLACVDNAMMDQERRLLDALQAADRFDIAEDGSLILYARDEEAIRARR
jgi:heat shock protein HslJ